MALLTLIALALSVQTALVIEWHDIFEALPAQRAAVDIFERLSAEADGAPFARGSLPHWRHQANSTAGPVFRYALLLGKVADDDSAAEEWWEDEAMAAAVRAADAAIDAKATAFAASVGCVRSKSRRHHSPPPAWDLFRHPPRKAAALGRGVYCYVGAAARADAAAHGARFDIVHTVPSAAKLSGGGLLELVEESGVYWPSRALAESHAIEIELAAGTDGGSSPGGGGGGGGSVTGTGTGPGPGPGAELKNAAYTRRAAATLASALKAADSAVGRFLVADAAGSFFWTTAAGRPYAPETSKAWNRALSWFARGDAEARSCGRQIAALRVEQGDVRGHMDILPGAGDGPLPSGACGCVLLVLAVETLPEALSLRLVGKAVANSMFAASSIQTGSGGMGGGKVHATGDLGRNRVPDEVDPSLGRARHPLWEMGLTGKGVVVGLVDVGLDEDSCYFADNVLSPARSGTYARGGQFITERPERATATRSKWEAPVVEDWRRKVVLYIIGRGNNKDAQSGDIAEGPARGHGTHNAGIIAGEIFDKWQGNQDWQCPWTPEPSPAPSPVPTVSFSPTVSPVPTTVPTPLPTPVPPPPTSTPTVPPTSVPTATPTSVPTETPTSAPTGFPTVPPTSAPTETPTSVPTETPTSVPTSVPTETPTSVPTPDRYWEMCVDDWDRSIVMSEFLTKEDCETPVMSGGELLVLYKWVYYNMPPEYSFSYDATEPPSPVPTSGPTPNPTTATPTAVPVPAPTAVPVSAPTGSPTVPPTGSPTVPPTSAPSETPTSAPSGIPTAVPSEIPTALPTSVPTASPIQTWFFVHQEEHDFVRETAYEASCKIPEVGDGSPYAGFARTQGRHNATYRVYGPDRFISGWNLTAPFNGSSTEAPSPKSTVSPVPTAIPTPAPTTDSQPTPVPTGTPTSAPTAMPSSAPTVLPLGTHPIDCSTATPGMCRELYCPTCQYQRACDQACYYALKGYGGLDGMCCENLIVESKGIAYEAKLAVYDVGGATEDEFRYPSAFESRVLSPLFEASGAPVVVQAFSHSFPNQMSSRDQGIDTFSWKKRALVVVPAGNHGEEHRDHGIAEFSSAKNALTVGATESGVYPTYPRGHNDEDFVAFFSSPGPTQDGRIKPEVVAPGYHIVAPDLKKQNSSSNYLGANETHCGVTAKHGTSAAASAAGGAAALLWQYFNDGHYASQVQRTIRWVEMFCDRTYDGVPVGAMGGRSGKETACVGDWKGWLEDDRETFGGSNKRVTEYVTGQKYYDYRVEWVNATNTTEGGWLRNAAAMNFSEPYEDMYDCPGAYGTGCSPFSPPGTLLKALLVASAKPVLAWDGVHNASMVPLKDAPDKHQGFGRINLGSIVPDMTDPADRRSLWVDNMTWITDPDFLVASGGSAAYWFTWQVLVNETAKWREEDRLEARQQAEEEAFLDEEPYVGGCHNATTDEGRPGVNCSKAMQGGLFTKNIDADDMPKNPPTHAPTLAPTVTDYTPAPTPSPPSSAPTRIYGFDNIDGFNCTDPAFLLEWPGGTHPRCRKAPYETSQYGLTFVLTWIEPPQSPAAPRQAMIAFDLRVVGPGGKVWYPNGLDFPDETNTIEKVFIPTATLRTDEYRAEVTCDYLAAGLGDYGVEHQFSLVVAGPGFMKDVRPPWTEAGTIPGLKWQPTSTPTFLTPAPTSGPSPMPTAIPTSFPSWPPDYNRSPWEAFMWWLEIHTGFGLEIVFVALGVLALCLASFHRAHTVWRDKIAFPPPPEFEYDPTGNGGENVDAKTRPHVVTCPDDCWPGDEVPVVVHGEKRDVEVPDGCRPGQDFLVQFFDHGTLAFLKSKPTRKELRRARRARRGLRKGKSAELVKFEPSGLLQGALAARRPSGLLPGEVKARKTQGLFSSLWRLGQLPDGVDETPPTRKPPRLTWLKRVAAHKKLQELKAKAADRLDPSTMGRRGGLLNLQPSGGGGSGHHHHHHHHHHGGGGGHHHRHRKDPESPRSPRKTKEDFYQVAL